MSTASLPPSTSETTQSVPRLGNELASLSCSLLPVMARHGIAMDFLGPSEHGLTIADATRNETGAYKIRGALAGALAAQEAGHLTVCTASAGNHGAGLAYAAKLLGLQAHIFVPETAPKAKTDKIEGFGAKVTKIGDTFDACLIAARSHLRSVGRESSFVHPFDQNAVVAGQGTMGLEIMHYTERACTLRKFSRVRIFVPVGGGGLAGGIACVIKNKWPNYLPTPEIIGVIDESSPASLLGTYFGRPVRAVPDTIADGTRVALVGNTFVSLAPLLDRILLIPHDEIVTTMRNHFRTTTEELEASGALAMAGESYARRLKLLPFHEPTLSFAIISGRNVDHAAFHATITATSRTDPAKISRIAYDVCIPEKPGQLRAFLHVVQDFNIAGLTYKQVTGSTSGTLRVDFDVDHERSANLDRKILDAFPGSIRLGIGQHALLQVGAPVASQYLDDLVTLEDKPGSFLRYIEQLNTPNALGSVGFLFYRKPAIAGARAQVVLGREHHEPLGHSIAH